MYNRIINSNINYRDLLCYKKAVVIYDLTYHFCSRFIDKKDRTYDQMVQAARSGKQNIVEGVIDKESSFEMSLKLLNVARGSLKELQEDYVDYLRVRSLHIWAEDSKEVDYMRKMGVEYADSDYYISLAESRSDETIANMVIVLLYQADTLLMCYIKSVEDRFASEGGVKEKMYRLRTQVRSKSREE